MPLPGPASLHPAENRAPVICECIEHGVTDAVGADANVGAGIDAEPGGSSIGAVATAMETAIDPFV